MAWVEMARQRRARGAVKSIFGGSGVREWGVFFCWVVKGRSEWLLAGRVCLENFPESRKE